MREVSDVCLIEQCLQGGGSEPFGILVRRYEQQVRRFFLAQTLGQTDLADDLAQDTFVRAYTHLAQFRKQSSFSTWLMRIAYNIFYDHTRQQKPHSTLEGEAFAGIERPSSVALHHDIYKALSLLKHEERLCVTLQLIEGYQIDEIASVANMPAGTVKSHLSRGKKKLSDYLKQNGYG